MVTREELEQELEAALAESDELEEMRRAVLGQTGVHLGMRLLQQYRTRFERDAQRLTERVTALRAQLAALEGAGSELTNI